MTDSAVRDAFETAWRDEGIILPTAWWWRTIDEHGHVLLEIDLVDAGFFSSWDGSIEDAVAIAVEHARSVGLIERYRHP